MSEEPVRTVTYPGELQETPDLPAMPLSKEDQRRLFEVLAGFSGEEIPEWYLRLRLGRLVSVPPWELHRCPPEWLRLAAAAEVVEAEVAEYRMQKAVRQGND